MRIGSNLILMGLSLCPAMAVELTPSASITPSIITTNLRGSTMPQVSNQGTGGALRRQDYPG